MAETKIAAGANAAANRFRGAWDLALDEVTAVLAMLLAGDDDPVVPDQRAASAQHRARGVLLPLHGGHHLLEAGAAPPSGASCSEGSHPANPGEPTNVRAQIEVNVRRQ